MVGERAELGAVVVGYRQPEMVTAALAALAAGSRRPDRVVVVDVDPLEPYRPGPEAGALDVTVLHTDDNPGYAAACNRGAAQSETDWLLFLNADVVVGGTTVAGLLEAARDDEAIGIAGPRLELPDGRLDHACHRGIPSVLDSLFYTLRLDRLAPRLRTLGHYRLTWLDPGGTHDIEACTGACLLIRREALDTVGGWDEAYRFYAEDLDLCLRVAQRGYRIRYLGTVDSTHLKGAFSGIGDTSRAARDPEREATRRWVRREIVASHKLFFEEHVRPVTAWPASLAIRAMFRLQRLQLDAAERLARSAPGP